MQRTALENLAKQLKRPPLSLQDFDRLSDEQLGWLSQQIEQLCNGDEQRLQQSLNHRLPWPFRWFVVSQLRK